MNTSETADCALHPFEKLRRLASRQVDELAAVRESLAAAGVRNKVQSGILAAVNYVYLGIFLNGDWSRADFFSSSDGCAWTVHEALNAGLPTALQALGFSAGIGKTIGASQRNLSIDIQAIRYDALRGG